VLEALASRETATATELAAELPVTRQAVAKHLGPRSTRPDSSKAGAKGEKTLYQLTPAPLGAAMGLDGRRLARSGMPASLR